MTSDSADGISDRKASGLGAQVGDLTTHRIQVERADTTGRPTRSSQNTAQGVQVCARIYHVT